MSFVWSLWTRAKEERLAIYHQALPGNLLLSSYNKYMIEISQSIRDRAGKLRELLADRGLRFATVLSREFFTAKIHWFDFTKNNPALAGFPVTDIDKFTEFVDVTLREADAAMGVGGYGEDRVLYRSKLFESGGEARSIHLAVDLWVPADTEVYTPLAGQVHSFQDNNNYLDYGPTIILEHKLGEQVFYTLYGHLSRPSLVGLQVGRHFDAGERIGWIGQASENGTWPPHLHFQVITDMLGKRGDFPGVAKPSESAEYLELCPDPNLVLRIPKE